MLANLTGKHEVFGSSSETGSVVCSIQRIILGPWAGDFVSPLPIFYLLLCKVAFYSTLICFE